MPQRAIPAVYMRGGTSKGVFFRARDLPADPTERDRLLLRVIGSPDPYGKHIDGMGGATPSTSKIVIVDRSSRDDCDVQFLFGQLAVDRDVIDYSGNCGNLTTAVGPFAITQGMVAAREGITTLRLWQQNIGKPIVAHVPVKDGEPIETGDFEMDGVPFSSAEIALEFLDAGGGDDGALLPTGHVIDGLEVTGIGHFDVTLINAGNPTVFIAAAALGLTGTELQPAINANRALLERLETIRAHAAVAMGIAPDAATATRKHPISPRLAFVSPPTSYVASSGKTVTRESIDITARIVSMGVLHHAFTGTGAVAIAVAAALPGSIVAQAATRARPLRVGHVAGAMTVGAEVRRVADKWIVDRVRVSRSARRLMSGLVYVSI